MSVNDLMREFLRLNVELEMRDGRLVLRAPCGVVDQELRERAVRHRDELKCLLRPRHNDRTSVELPYVDPDPIHRYDPFPLNDMQRAYWLGRDTSFALGGVGIHVYEELDCVDLRVNELQDAWQKVVDRHDALRILVLEDGRQQVLPTGHVEIDVLDLMEDTDLVQGKRLMQLRERLSHRVQRLEEWPSFRMIACCLDKSRVRLILSLDATHIDMGGFAVLFREWLGFYTNPTYTPPPIPISFRDYVLAAARLPGNELHQRSLAYWERLAETLPPPPRLPYRQQPQSLERSHVERRKGTLDLAAWRRLKERAAQAQITPSGVVLAAYAEVLGAWNEDPRFTVNVTHFNPMPLHDAVDQVVGNFTSLLLLEADRNAGRTFKDRAAAIQKRLLEGLRHPYVSGMDILHMVARRQAREPGELIMPVVFTSMLNMRTQGLGHLNELGERVFNVMQTPQVCLDLQVSEQDDALTYNWDAVDRLFPDGLMDDLCRAFHNLLTRLASEEGGWTTSGTRMVPSEQLKRREEVNRTEAAYPDVPIHALLADQLSTRAREAAVMSASGSLSYHELDARSRRLAAQIAVDRKRNERLVAIVMRKGWEQIVAALAIVRAGAAFLPVDANLPARRLQFTLENGRVDTILTQSQLEPLLAWPSGPQRVSVDRDDGWEVDTIRTEPRTLLHDLAYVIYTSGSTGKPKGVMIEHRSLVNRVVDVNRRFAVGPDDRILSVTGLHHDLAIYDVFGLLYAGGTIILPDPECEHDPCHWLDLMRRERVTVWNSVPSLMELLLDHIEREGISQKNLSIRLVFLSGDRIPLDLPKRVGSSFEGARVVCLGGPTETTIWDICEPIDAIDPEWVQIPYGRPMANSRYYVLNDALEPCPDLVMGELFGAGIGLARGYWRDEDRTREAFPLHPETGERLYRSGDRGRFLADGRIEIVGRRDFQLKVAGVRVEAGEVEATISAHPGVRAAVVIADGEGASERRLIAYVVPESRVNAMLDAEALELKLSRPGLRRNLVGRSEIQLGRHQYDTDERLEAYRLRRTYRHFSPDPIEGGRLGGLLAALGSVHLPGYILPKFRYPSAGNLNPIQTYVHVKADRISDLAAGIYYHHPERNTLVRIGDGDVASEVHLTHNVRASESAAFTIFLLADDVGISTLYAERSRDFCLIEAGCMVQLLMTEAPDHRLGLCPVGQLDFERIRDLFDVPPGAFLAVALLGGSVDTTEPFATVEREKRHQNRLDLRLQQDAFIAELRDHLKKWLPRSMIPAEFVLLDALPFSANGKVDRSALVPVVRRSPRYSRSRDRPLSDLEAMVTGVVEDVLGVQGIALRDRFFDLGATSFDLVNIAGRLHHVCDRDLTITDLFTHTTIYELCDYLATGQRSSASVEAAERRADRRRGNLLGNWVHANDGADHGTR